MLGGSHVVFAKQMSGWTKVRWAWSILGCADKDKEEPSAPDVPLTCLPQEKLRFCRPPFLQVHNKETWEVPLTCCQASEVAWWWKDSESMEDVNVVISWEKVTVKMMSFPAYEPIHSLFLPAKNQFCRFSKNKEENLRRVKVTEGIQQPLNC